MPVAVYVQTVIAPNAEPTRSKDLEIHREHIRGVYLLATGMVAALGMSALAYFNHWLSLGAKTQ